MPIQQSDRLGDSVIDYKDIRVLRRFLTERGKIVPRRVSKLSQKQQKELVKAIKRARILALLSFVSR